jgi:hypothetical protein
MLPALCVYAFYNRGFRTALYCGVLAFAPMAVSLVATSVFSGWEGVLATFQQQASRNFNGESTYDAFNYLFGTQLKAAQIPLIPQALQIVPGLVAAAMRPRTFPDLVNASIFAVLGFITFSPFYSPQFVLWVLPLVCFSDSRSMLWSAVALSWLTYLYFPIAYDKVRGTIFFEAVIVAVTSLRFLMMFLSLQRWHDRPKSAALG